MFSSKKKLLFFILMDVIIIWGSIYFSYFSRFTGDIPHIYQWQLVEVSFITSVVCIGSLLYFRLYSRLWKYASIEEVISIIKAVTISCVSSYLIIWIMSGFKIPLSVIVHSEETMVLLLGGIRLVWKLFNQNNTGKNVVKDKALIVGAGACGSMIAKELKQNPGSNIEAVAFIDDDPLKHHQHIHDIPVIGGVDNIIEISNKLNITHIIIAIPSAKKCKIAPIIQICKQTKAQVKIIPQLNDLIEGKLNINQIRNVEVEDLLGREPVQVDRMTNYVMNKNILVTGAGGSIGSELCRQIAAAKPVQLILLGHGENSIYTIEMELRTKNPQLKLISIIADIQDRKRMDQVFDTYRPEVVFHAAAHKHVPLMEANPSEAIKNNVLGTMNVAECANRYGVERFVLISSDKAVNPTSVMGATKRIAEMFIQGLSISSKTIYTSVRFGNVLGSRGSVIPRFKEQIRNGGPVTVTHPEMIRYFMTIPEAVQLVIQAGALAKGGEIFVLDMGRPIKIVDLARDLIRLSGFEPDQDISIQYSGIRPGEKLYEELLTQEEGVTSTKHDRIFIAKPSYVDLHALKMKIRELEKVLGKDSELIRISLNSIVDSYMLPSAQSSTISAQHTANSKEVVFAIAGAGAGT